MKKRIGLAFLAAALGAATLNPVAWEIQDVSAKAVKPGERFAVRLVARIEGGWHLYSLRQLPEGPIATRIWLAEGQPFELAGQIKAERPQLTQDPGFNMELESYEGEAVFTLTVRAAPTAPAGPQKLLVAASYQACNDTLCLPPRTVMVEAPLEVKK